MALTNAQRKKLLARVLVKVQTEQLDGDVVLTRLVAAIGTNLDDELSAEAVRWKADLAAAKAQAQANIAAIDAEVPAIGT
jgi:GGDEF domain-containing protein